MNEIICIIDQKESRTVATPRIAEVINRLAALRSLRKGRDYVQSLGDEVQVVVLPPQLSTVVDLSARNDCWLGVGIGPIERPGNTLLQTTGTALTLARDAVEQSKKLPWGACVIGVNEWAVRLHRALGLYMTVARSRSEDGWEAIELRDRGLRADQIAARLGISPSAASKRLRNANYRATEEGRRLLKDFALHGRRGERIE
jgi:hypothetical protein